jgi:drug/metabolite transporter (DMT)-like permease
MNVGAQRSRGVMIAVGAAVISGFAVFVNGLGVRRFDDPTVYTTAKNLIAAAILVIALVATTTVASDRRPTPVPRSAWPTLALIAVIGGAVPFVLFFEGLARATSTNSAFIHKTLVVWVAVGATVFLKERLTWVHVSAIALLVLGHLMLTGGLGGATFGSAELLIFGATMCWATEVLIVKRMLVTVPYQMAVVCRMVGGSVLLVGWLAIKGGLGALTGFAPYQVAWLLFTGTTLAVFVGTWYCALSLAPAIDVTAVLVLGAVITGLLTAGFRGVPLTVDSYGYVLIALGAIAVAANAMRTPATQQVRG